MKRYISIKESSNDNLTKLLNEVSELFKETKSKMIKQFKSSIINNAQNELNNYNNTNKLKRFSKYLYLNRTNYISFLFKHSPTKGALPEFREDYEQIATKKATELANDYINLYKNRLSDKMRMILKSKNLIKIDLLKVYFRSQIEAEFKFTFEQGSFQVKSQIVWVINRFGTQFNRFPFTIHDIYYPDGRKVKKDSIENVEIGFLNNEIKDVSATKAYDKEQRKKQKNINRKLKSQINIKLGIEASQEILVDIGDKVLIKKRNEKFIKDLNINPTIKITTKSNEIFDILSGKIITVEYIDGTKIKFSITRMYSTDHIKSSAIIRNKNIGKHLGFDFYFVEGIITEVINRGKIVTNL